jgi:hypothetical protein
VAEAIARRREVDRATVGVAQLRAAEQRVIDGRYLHVEQRAPAEPEATGRAALSIVEAQDLQVRPWLAELEVEILVDEVAEQRVDRIGAVADSLTHTINAAVFNLEGKCAAAGPTRLVAGRVACSDKQLVLANR